MTTRDSAGNATPADMPEQNSRTAIRLGGWSFYFLAKFLLVWRDLIGFHPIENLAFAAFLLVPITSRPWRRLRTAIAIPIAAALLHYDSWLPPIDRVLSQASLLSNFSATYLLELAGRFINWPVVAMLVLGLAAYRIAARFLRVGFVVVIALIAFAAIPRQEQPVQIAPAATGAQMQANTAATGESVDLDTVLRDFHTKEAQRRVKFPKAENAVPFDIIFIHVCSLSWDDLRTVGLHEHPLWKSFDFLFRRFNAVASYSGPAVIRINRATCGQAQHKALYAPTSDQCYLLPGLKQAGFETDLALNHDGHFDDFLLMVRQQGVNAPLMPLNGVPAPLRAFDNSPIYDDFAVLSRWLETRQKSDNARVALFYNTISLHDGNRIISGPDAKLSSSDNYRPRVVKLLNDLTAFMDQMQKDGRRAIVVVVPEHGAALRGDKFQIAGLREIPTPSITTVPVGVKIIGQDVVRKGGAGGTSNIDEPTSYLGLSQLIARLIEHPPYGEAGFSAADYAADIPVTEYVAENEATVMIQRNNRYFLKQDRDAWKEYASAP
jgi:cellulose synthase operon protein YhjU